MASRAFHGFASFFVTFGMSTSSATFRVSSSSRTARFNAFRRTRSTSKRAAGGTSVRFSSAMNERS
ncbi:hypothetical protein SCALM49S_02527 [Streptomyces californicus]